MKKKIKLILIFFIQFMIFFTIFIIHLPQDISKQNNSYSSLKNSQVGSYTRLINDTLISYNGTNEQYYPCICPLSNETFTIAWESNHEDGSDFNIYANTYNITTGENITSEFRINYNITNTQFTPCICALSNDIIVAAWASQGQDGHSSGIFSRIFDAKTGYNISEEFQVNDYITNDQSYPSICALSNEIFVIAWQSDGQDGDDYGIYAKTFNATSGKNITLEYQLNYNTTLTQYYPNLSRLSNETFAVTWSSAHDSTVNISYAYNVYSRAFNAFTGNNISAEFRVNNYNYGAQFLPSICAITNETVYITWCGAAENATSSVIQSTIVNVITGKNITSEIIVNSNTNNNQVIPSICELSNEVFAISWCSDHQELLNYEIYARIFNMSTNDYSSIEFQVNQNSTNDQYYPSICALSNDVFVITWQSNETGMGYDIHFSVFKLKITLPFNEVPSGDDKVNLDELIRIILIVSLVGAASISTTTASVWYVYVYKRTTKIAKKVGKNKIKKGKKNKKFKKSNDNGTKKVQTSQLTSEEIITHMNDNKDLIEFFDENSTIDATAPVFDKSVTLISKNFLDSVDKIGFTDTQKLNFIKEMLSFSPIERDLITDDILKNVIIPPIPPPVIKPEKDQVETLEEVIPHEVHVLNYISEYLEKNRQFETKKIILFLNSRFSKASIDININGIKRILKSLVERNILVEGSKMIRDDVLSNSNRKDVYEYIQNNPGVNFNNIFKNLNINSSVARWHLNMLEKFGFIRKEVMQSYNAYFDLEIDEEYSELLHLISREKYSIIINFMKENNYGLSKTKLSKELGMHINTIDKYLNKLSTFELIKKEKVSKKTLFFLNKELYDQLEDKILIND